MLEIIAEIIDNHMTQSSSDKDTQKYANHKVIEMILEKSLQTRKFHSEYIFFGDPREEKISAYESDEIKYPVSIDIERTDGKCDHGDNILVNIPEYSGTINASR
jgi:hypothetical protein